jgi:O-antigen ligase
MLRIGQSSFERGVESFRVKKRYPLIPCNNLPLKAISDMRTFSVLGVCIYVASFAFPFNFKFDLPLMILALASIPVTVGCMRNKTFFNLPLALPVILFLISFGMSSIVSEDTKRSLLLSMHFLPAVLLYFLVTKAFESTKNTSNLYLAASIAMLGLASGLFYAFLSKIGSGPFGWVLDTESPVMVVKNDVTFLAVMCPLCLALVYLRPRSISGMIGALSLFICVAVMGVFQSRVAVLTMIISISCFFIGIHKSKAAFAYGLAVLIMILMVDFFMGFPLIERFIRHWDGSGRIPLWVSAWQMFLESPVVGHGPHTFGTYYSSYISNHIFPSWLFVDSRFVPWPHNLYLEVLAEEGIIGFVALVILLYKGLSASWNLRNAIATETRILGVGSFAALVGFCFASSFELTFLRQWVVITMFMLLGVIAQLSCIANKNGGGNL